MTHRNHISSGLCATLLAMCITSCNNIDPDSHECEIGTWGNFSTAAVSFTFDDNLPNQFDIALPIFDRYGFKATFYPTIKDIDDWQHLIDAATNGHEIGSHTIEHQLLPSCNPEKIDSELSQSQAIINQHIGNNSCLTIAYPYCGQVDSATVCKYYIAARICDNHIEPATPLHYHAISSFGIGSESSQYKTANSVISVFEQAKQKAGWCSLLIHEIDNGNGYSPFPSASLDSTLNYLALHEDHFWVATFADVVKYTYERNLTDIVLLDEDDNEISLAFTNTLDSRLFNVPITIRRPLPAYWQNAEVTQNNNTVDSFVRDGFIYFNVRPNFGNVTITRQ